MLICLGNIVKNTEGTAKRSEIQILGSRKNKMMDKAELLETCIPQRPQKVENEGGGEATSSSDSNRDGQKIYLVRKRNSSKNHNAACCLLSPTRSVRCSPFPNFFSFCACPSRYV